MVTDSITNASFPSAPNARDLGKKKRARTAKLKQSKLDVRREQWLSQGVVKSKGCKDDRSGVVIVKVHKEDNRSVEKLEARRREEENDGLTHDEVVFSESPSNSLTSLASSVLSASDSGTHFSGSSSSSGGCCSGNITEEEGEDECLDDWEAFADALAANDKQQESPCSESPSEHELIAHIFPCRESRNGLRAGPGDSEPGFPRMVPSAPENSRAWRPDDAFRPPSLPNLSKQVSLPNSDRRYGCGGVSWACSNVSTVPTSCPVCFEDLDFTDTSFLPCFCGFRLCLFCHKRILEEDGRCPGCRKRYNHDHGEAEPSIHGEVPTFRLARSCSMISRS